MLSGQVGRYKYYELEDMYKSAGCQLCHFRAQWWNNSFPDEPKDLHEECMKCPILFAVKLTKLYAKELDKYERYYEDDGK